MLALARYLDESRANGPGLRSVFWFQGCTLGCTGCINPWSHPRSAVDVVYFTPQQLLQMVNPRAAGITLTGGEPFQQPLEELTELCTMAQQRRLSVVVFTGYTLEELEARCNGVPRGVDLLITGRYDHKRRVTGQPLIASANQQVHFLTRRYNPSSLDDIVASEVHIWSGNVARTGVE